jgi:hypothetical protein
MRGPGALEVLAKQNTNRAGYRWQEICELRRRQLEVMNASLCSRFCGCPLTGLGVGELPSLRSA